MFTMKDASLFKEQLDKGEWVPNTRREWSHETGSAKTYTLTRGNTELWVSNGLFFLKFKTTKLSGGPSVKLPFLMKVYLRYILGVGSFVKECNKAFNKKDKEACYKELFEESSNEIL